MGALSAQDTRTLTLKSGDKITGQVVEETDTTLTIINPLMGQMVIDKSSLKERVISITLKSGDKIGGTLVSRSATEIVVATAFGDVSIPTDQVETINDQSSSTPTIRHTPFGTTIVSKSTGSDEWFFSNERLMDVWFDPTGYTIGKNKLYMSGLSWGFGLTDKVQITSRWTSYFINDFNIRPKVTFFKAGTIESETAAAGGLHIHTRGLPGKYKWEDDAFEDYDYNAGESSSSSRGGYVRLGSTRDENGYHNDGFGDGDQMWFELFGAYTMSKLRTGGDGRMNTTFGASAVMYPGEDIAPRLFAAFDTDVTQSVKVMAEIFYDAYYPEIQNFDSDSKMASSLHFDIGFLTNRISFSEDFWMGFHFQRPFISFYWKI
jgi:RNase P/RNase MRP subunit p29